MFLNSLSRNLHNDKNPVIVTFDRTGTLEYLYIGGTQVPITLPIYFLIGKREQIPNVDPTKPNWADQENLWISLNPQSGLASTAEIATASDCLFLVRLCHSGPSHGR